MTNDAMSNDQSMPNAKCPKAGGVRLAIGHWGLVIHWTLHHWALGIFPGALVGTAPAGKGRYSTTFFSGGGL
jgi:hypothetical protein